MNPDVMNTLYHMLPLLVDSSGQLKSNTKATQSLGCVAKFSPTPRCPVRCVGLIVKDSQGAQPVEFYGTRIRGGACPSLSLGGGNGHRGGGVDGKGQLWICNSGISGVLVVRR